MFGLSRKTAEPDQRDVEQLIYDVAEHDQKKDHKSLYRALADCALFMPVEPESLPEGFAPGTQFDVDADMGIKARMIAIPEQGNFLPIATRDTAEIVAGGYVGIAWMDFLEMAQNVPSAKGVLVQGERSWVAFDQKRVGYILKLLKK